MNKLDEAREKIDKIVKKYPWSGNFLALKAQVEYAAGDYDKAVHTLGQAMKIAPYIRDKVKKGIYQFPGLEKRTDYKEIIEW